MKRTSESETVWDPRKQKGKAWVNVQTLGSVIRALWRKGTEWLVDTRHGEGGIWFFHQQKRQRENQFLRLHGRWDSNLIQTPCLDPSSSWDSQEHTHLAGSRHFWRSSNCRGTSIILLRFPKKHSKTRTCGETISLGKWSYRQQSTGKGAIGKKQKSFQGLSTHQTITRNSWDTGDPETAATKS